MGRERSLGQIHLNSRHICINSNNFQSPRFNQFDKDLDTLLQHRDRSYNYLLSNSAARPRFRELFWNYFTKINHASIMHAPGFISRVNVDGMRYFAALRRAKSVYVAQVFFIGQTYLVWLMVKLRPYSAKVTQILTASSRGLRRLNA